MSAITWNTLAYLRLPPPSPSSRVLVQTPSHAATHSDEVQVQACDEDNDFETDLPDVEVDDHSQMTKHQPHILIKGESVQKSQALRLWFAANTKVAERVQRAIGMSKNRSDPLHQARINSQRSDGSVRVNMIVACVVEVKGSAVMVVSRVERCDPGNTTEIAESNFDDGNYTVSGRVLLIKHKPDGYTWRSGAYSQSRLTNISVKHIIAIKPSATTTTFNDRGNLTGVKYTFGGELDEAFGALDPGSWKKGSLAQIQTAGNIPYKNRDGADSFTYESTFKSKSKRKRKVVGKRNSKDKTRRTSRK